jgi:acyl-CoA thioester hydrolase
MSKITRDLNDYGFSTEIRVRLSETDAVGIVFFGSFALYFDVGRMDYLAQLGLHHLDGVVKDLIPGAVVHQESHFHSPARYNDILVVHVRMARIGTTSYTFQFLLQQKRTRTVVCTGSLTLAWLDDDFKPMTIPDAFRQTVAGFEGARLEDTSAE